MSYKKRYTYIDIVKIVSILSVITIHVSAMYWYKTDIYSARWCAMNFWNALSRFCIGTFVMCTGVLFLNREELTYKELFKKYLFKLGGVFIIWMLIYSFIKNNYQMIGIIENIKQKLPEGHLWFLIMIIGIYLILPIIRIFVKNAQKKDLEYFLLLSFIIQSIIPFIIVFNQFSWLDIYYKLLYPSVVTGYVGVLVLGYYLNNYEMNKKNKILIMILGILSILFTIFMNLYEARITGKPTTKFFKEYYPNIIIISMFVFVLIKCIVEKIKFSDKQKNVITEISNSVFGIYLIHYLIIELVDIFGVNALMLNTYLAIPITTIIVFIFSLFIVLIMRKISIINKFV